MQSLLVDVNRIRNLSTKNSFVAHEACQRAWKSLAMLCFEDDLIADGFTERFKFDSKPSKSAKWRPTPSIEDSDYSSSAPTVVARVIDEEDDATSPAMASLHQDAASCPSLWVGLLGQVLHFLLSLQLSFVNIWFLSCNT